MCGGMRNIIVVILFCICGCISIDDIRGLKTLKRVSGSQARQDKVIKIQEAKFQKLLKYIQNDKLRKGSSKKWVMSAFGEPSLVREIKDDAIRKEFIMYRHPDKFFGSERVYLYFNKDHTLIEWKREEGY